MDQFPSKPYTVGNVTSSQAPADIDQMFTELYNAGAEMNDEITTLEAGGTSSGGVTIAQVMARVVLSI